MICARLLSDEHCLLTWETPRVNPAFHRADGGVTRCGICLYVIIHTVQSKSLSQDTRSKTSTIHQRGVVDCPSISRVTFSTPPCLNVRDEARGRGRFNSAQVQRETVRDSL